MPVDINYFEVVRIRYRGTPFIQQRPQFKISRLNKIHLKLRCENKESLSIIYKFVGYKKINNSMLLFHSFRVFSDLQNKIEGKLRTVVFDRAHTSMKMKKR